MQSMQWMHATVLVLTLACSGAWAQGKADPLRTEDRDKHSQMGEAHAAAAACLQAQGANRQTCHKQLQTDCHASIPVPSMNSAPAISCRSRKLKSLTTTST
jgi:hypothetical protein